MEQPKKEPKNDVVNGPYLDPKTGLFWSLGKPLMMFNYYSPSWCKIKTDYKGA